MKNRKKYLVIGISIPLICCLILVYLFFIKTEEIEIVWMPTPDIQEQIGEYMEAGYCMGGEASEDGLGAVIRLSEWQRRKWLKFLYGDVEQFLKRANEIEHMRIYVSPDTRELTVYADREVNFQTLATYLGIISWDIENIQILKGEVDWGFDFTVKDMATEKVLYTAFFPKDGVKVYEYFWDEIEE